MEDVLDPASMPWELIPFTFIRTSWFKDSDFGWLEFCLLDEEHFSQDRLWRQVSLLQLNPSQEYFHANHG